MKGVSKQFTLYLPNISYVYIIVKFNMNLLFAAELYKE